MKEVARCESRLACDKFSLESGGVTLDCSVTSSGLEFLKLGLLSGS